MISLVIFGVIAIYLIVVGVKIFITGTLTSREEEKLAQYTEESVRPYKIAYAVGYILGGLMLAGISVVRYLSEQKVIESAIPFYIVLLVPVAICVIALVLTRKKFKTK